MSYLLAINVQTVCLIFAAQFLSEYLNEIYGNETDWTKTVWFVAVVVILYSWYAFLRFLVLQDKRRSEEQKEVKK